MRQLQIYIICIEITGKSSFIIKVITQDLEYRGLQRVQYSAFPLLRELVILSSFEPAFCYN